MDYVVRSEKARGWGATVTLFAGLLFVFAALRESRHSHPLAADLGVVFSLVAFACVCVLGVLTVLLYRTYGCHERISAMRYVWPPAAIVGAAYGGIRLIDWANNPLTIFVSAGIIGIAALLGLGQKSSS